MSYYETLENVKEYIEMAKEYQSTLVVDLLKRHLSPGKSILELGMGPGNDFKCLVEDYDITGTDKYEHFISLFKEGSPDANVQVLDAVDLDINQQFDCIYSNKVLMHLTKEELHASLKKQWALLNEGGILFHTFWHGEDKEYHGGMLNQYYTKKMLEYQIGDEFDVVLMAAYEEFEPNDSIVMVLKKRALDK
jgi:cyclopropane fatty-acyl-phospholipid synthase-like methyltransferase